MTFTNDNANIIEEIFKIAGWGITTLEQETSNKCEIFFAKTNV